MSNHICYIVDDNYHDLALSSIESARKNCTQELQFHILGNIEAQSSGINYIDVPSSLADLHILDYRAVLPHIMTDNGITKFLYLDADTTPMVCLSKLIELHIDDNNVVAGCTSSTSRNFKEAIQWTNSRDFNYFKEHVPDIHLDATFINTGVLLFDCIRYVDENILSDYLVHKANCNLPYPVDEWIFNLSIMGRCKFIDNRWNSHPGENDKQWRRPYIIHDIGISSRKPRHSSTYT